jgi:transcriptional regulator with XRE-family HTH domain
VGNRNGTVRQRILGRRLRRLREQAGHTLEEAAAALEISASRLARIETAQQGVDVHVVKSMLDLRHRRRPVGADVAAGQGRAAEAMVGTAVTR